MYTIVYVAEIRININYKGIKGHKDSEKREEHILDRMALRGIGIENIKILSFVKGTNEFKIVADKEYVEDIKDLFSNKIRKIEDDLSEVSFVLSEKVLKQKGILAEIANEIYIHDINISEILICPPEFLILVKKKDMVKTHEIIIGLTE